MIRTVALLASTLALASAAKHYSVGSHQLVGSLQDAEVEGLCDTTVKSLSGVSRFTRCAPSGACDLITLVCLPAPLLRFSQATST